MNHNASSRGAQLIFVTEWKDL